MSHQRLITHSEKETILAAEKIAASFNGDEVVLLTGDLGAGKTVFTKGIALGLGLQNIDQVCSPSYTILNVYKSKFDIYHFDFYRLSKGETSQLGWEDYLGCGVMVVEWAEKMDFKGKAFRIRIEIGTNEERVIFIKN
ncbi:MAG: tRNA (adenosine(37)-N6)-threonylcarbamoyltransferase complex ATPase subunit type 1 TsaE [Candidatus Aminicenantes bacterium]|nr:tRNA (adenosine(37)-N6)-threonylcarbamoyltransferase complex ATPase subunit type 1 TsaE [Candidatus Aminicenantes bacterium]